MKKFLLLGISSCLFTMISFAQTTELFETETDGAVSFSDNGVTFNIISHTGRFYIQKTYPNTGWDGAKKDDGYIDNSGTLNGIFDHNAVLNSSISIKTTSNLFRVSRFWVFLGDINANPGAVTGTLNVTGKRGGVVKYSETKTSGFTTTLATNNGYTLIDLTSFNTPNIANIVIDELQLTIGGDYRYLGIDAFSWTKEAAVLPVSFTSIKAGIKNKQLFVNWSTGQELANDHFEIEASADGQQFNRIATVASLASNGNSNVPLHYEWTMSGALPLAALSVFTLTLAAMVPASRKRRMLMAIAVTGIAVLAVTGCTKNNEAIDDSAPLYIRVAQVDKDGTKTYSKVVKVQQD